MEGGGEAGVHCGGLLDGEGLELGEADVHEDSAEDYGDHADEDLGFFHLGHGARAPRLVLAKVGDRSAVEEAELVGPLEDFGGGGAVFFIGDFVEIVRQ